MFVLLHIIHLLTVILWIGGLAFVTIIVLPMAIKTPDALQKVLLFQRIEHRFANLARVFNVITGASGIVMILMTGWYKALFTKGGIALTVMTVIWVFWFIMLFGLEPLIIKKMLERMAKGDRKLDIDSIFVRLNRMHWLMLAVSLAAAAAGAIAAHGSPF